MRVRYLLGKAYTGGMSIRMIATQSISDMISWKMLFLLFGTTHPRIVLIMPV
ncbi:MAG: hypothetical protein HY810_10070 [Candidatus Omnitrophica bacterium]|nr:hypothetical protein [Candidatus Omnitrophota bacterium]